MNYARVSGIEGAKVMAGMSNDDCQMWPYNGTATYVRRGIKYSK